MSLRCKPGDRVLVIQTSTGRYVGLQTRVIRSAANDLCADPLADWVIDASHVGDLFGDEASARDSWLLPLRGDPDAKTENHTRDEVSA